MKFDSQGRLVAVRAGRPVRRPTMRTAIDAGARKTESQRSKQIHETSE